MASENPLRSPRRSPALPGSSVRRSLQSCHFFLPSISWRQASLLTSSRSLPLSLVVCLIPDSQHRMHQGFSLTTNETKNTPAGQGEGQTLYYTNTKNPQPARPRDQVSHFLKGGKKKGGMGEEVRRRDHSAVLCLIVPHPVGI